VIEPKPRAYLVTLGDETGRAVTRCPFLEYCNWAHNWRQATEISYIVTKWFLLPLWNHVH